MQLLITVSVLIVSVSAHSMMGSGYGSRNMQPQQMSNSGYRPISMAQRPSSLLATATMVVANQASQQQPQAQQMSRGQPTSYDNYEAIFDSQRDGWNHPWVVYDSRRDGLDSPLRSQFDSDPNLNTIFDSKVDGWNHPWVVYDSRRDGPQRKY